MQFKHPEILYFLFALVIPILVHLFQLRRFKKEFFTNVKLLKELQTQTRKSATIKKWLLLFTRLFLLACLIIAFAQPFFTAKNAAAKNNELVILLDNSFSMQAKGENGELLKRSIQDILENFDENQQFSLLTTNETFWDVDAKTIQNELQKITYAPFSFEVDYLLTQVASKKPNTTIDYFIISDAVDFSSKKLTQISGNNAVYFWQPKAQNTNNIAISNVRLLQSLENLNEIEVELQRFGNFDEAIPLAVYQNDTVIAKAIVQMQSEKETVKLALPKKEIQAKVTIQDNSLSYDNDYFFTLGKPQKPKVTFIGTAAKNKFLNRIITTDEFEVTDTELAQLNYSKIEEQNTIILNELAEIPQALQTNLKAFYEKGGNIVLIPSEENNLANLNQFLNTFGRNTFTKQEKNTKNITKISFKHPLFNQVFEKEVSNFQYPNTTSSLTFNGNAAGILQYDDGSNFLASIGNQLGKFYVFATPINKQQTNFQNSPLIVPVFYNMAMTNANANNQTFTIGANESFLIEATLSKDEVVSIQNASSSFIPMQQILPTKVKINFGDYPEQAGNFAINQKNNTIAKVSFNYPRNESNLNTNTTLPKVNYVNNSETVLNTLLAERTDTILWKWFLMATLLFLLIELLIQKFVK
jgi:hypothetical protein